MSAGRPFFDTNVWLYLYSDGDPSKHVRAQALFDECISSGGISVSTQVIQEFYAAGLRKLAISRTILLQAVNRFLEMNPVIISGQEILAAFDLEERYQISFWDALIVAAAEKGGADVLYTEDLNDGQRYGNVVAKNPFRAGSGVSGE
jgi:predicted nucleic acid-binding protein